VPDVLYPTLEEVIEANRLLLQRIRVRKADRHGVLMGKVGREKIRKAIEDLESLNGDIYEKAAVLLIGIVRGHLSRAGTGGRHMRWPWIFSNRTVVAWRIPTMSK